MACKDVQTVIDKETAEMLLDLAEEVIKEVINEVKMRKRLKKIYSQPYQPLGRLA